MLSNEIPGIRSYEERGYWRDVGTLEAYWQANMDLLGETPLFDLRNSGWPILSGPYRGPMASLVRTRMEDSMIGQGSQCVETVIHRSVIGRGVRIDRGAHLEECVIMDGVHIGPYARLRRVLADRSAVIPSWSRIGHETGEDRKRFHVSQSGLVVVSGTSMRPMDFMRRAS
jgi:glucose-1-phosphate adenylyltransferase